MNNIKLLLPIILACFIISCGSDDDAEASNQDEIVGVWTLKSVENQGVNVPTVDCRVQQTVTYNVNFSGGESFPENDTEPCDFSTTNFTWNRNSSTVTLNVAGEGTFVNEIILVNATQLQTVVVERNGVSVSQNQREIYRYEK